MILEQSTNTLLFNPTDYKAIYDQLHELHDLYALHSNVSAGNITDQDMWLPSGNAVSPIKAAFCLLEIQRTAVFIRGINKAILSLQLAFPGQRIHILYAGCGPYATLLTPFTTRFTKDEIAFHLLDINEVSLTAAKKLYQGLQIEDYVVEWICGDATTYRLPNDLTIHLVISETMLNALRKEPQVEIMLNLVPQLDDKALFIPDNITVSAELLDSYKETYRYLEPEKTPERLNLGTIYSIGRKQCEPHAQVTIEIPQQIENFKQLNLLTTITTFDDEQLGIYDSSLNMPLRIADVAGYEGRKITFDYERGAKPGFRHEWF
jgi:predicted RNA methylase